MLHHLFMAVAAFTRFIKRVIFRFLLVIVLVGFNIATVVSDRVYDGLNRFVWGGVQMVSETVAERRPKTRSQIDTDLRQSRAKLTTAEATLLETRSKFDDAKIRIQTLETDAAAQKQRLNSAEARVRHIETDFKQARLAAVKARAEVDAALAETNQVRRQLDVTLARNRNLVEELDASKTRIDLMTNEINLSKKNRSEALETASALRSRVIQSIRRDASSEAIEAVPFIGAAVFLGTVAYDLNDSCNQLRELETLDAILRNQEPERIDEGICLLSFEELVASLTGQDRGYARCVSDRLATKQLNPASCMGYEPAIPQINDSPLRQQARPIERLSID